MPASTTLLQFLLMPMLVAGGLHRQRAAVIEYVKTENRLLCDRLGTRRIIFTDAERRQLAEKARTIRRKVLGELGKIVTPETLFPWHRELAARKWTFVERRRPESDSARHGVARTARALFGADTLKSPQFPSPMSLDCPAAPGIRASSARA